MPRPGRHRADNAPGGVGPARRSDGSGIYCVGMLGMGRTHPSTVDSQRSSLGSSASLRDDVSGRVSSTMTSGTVVDGSLMTSPRVRSALELLASPLRLPLPLPLPLPPLLLPVPLRRPLPLELVPLPVSLPLLLLLQVALAPWSAGAASAEALSALAPGTADICSEICDARRCGRWKFAINSGLLGGGGACRR